MKLNKHIQNAYGKGGKSKASPPSSASSGTSGPADTSGPSAPGGKKGIPRPVEDGSSDSPARSRDRSGGTSRARPPGKSGLVKTGLSGDDFLKIISRSAPEEKPSIREIAGLLMLMGTEQASRILALLPDDMVEKISLEISRIRVLKPEESKAIIEKFQIAAGREQERLRGGKDVARDILERSIGRRKAVDILARTSSSPGFDQLDFLNELEPGQLKQLLKDEPPRLIGIILSHLEPGRAAGLLKDLPAEKKPRIIRSMGEKVKLSQDVLHNIAKAIKGKIRRIGTQQTNELDGAQVLAEILRSMDASSERNILEDLGIEAPDVESRIKERLFTIDRVLHIRDTDLQRILADMADEDIALLMKGKDENIRVRFLKNVSSQRSIAISENYHYLGPVPRKDVDESTRDFILKLRRMEERGDIVIPRNDEPMVE
ncbi:flagellar motor switch protein FliG [Salinispira pacifica]|uniref:Flagellar motor switch protein FliG n=1 Tax=Salinispira pacifica TaxID=1307761 RepID=V5WH08_9SPIO|nr:flagellar motor switch protein FliG [Salinispira pacifica]AHC14451.1 hypothetical protein L21SP2_1035 [Salinispira pacifica]